jgi:hypothetical protein
MNILLDVPRAWSFHWACQGRIVISLGVPGALHTAKPNRNRVWLALDLAYSKLDTLPSQFTSGS